MKKSYSIEVDCGNCANKMELAASKVAGVEAVAVNFLAQKIIVTFGEDAEPRGVMEQIQKVCQKIDSDCTIDF